MTGAIVETGTTKAIVESGTTKAIAVGNQITEAVSYITTKNTDTVAANQHGIPTGTAAFSGGVGTSVEYLSVEHISRIGITGSITGARIPVETAHASANITHMSIKIWRKNPDLTNMTLVGQSNNFEADMTGVPNTSIADITFSSPITGVQEGDYYSIRVEFSSDPGNMFDAVDGVQAVATEFVVDTDPATGHDWDAGTNNGFYIPIELQTQSPNIVIVGDSVAAGHTQHDSFIETSTAEAIESQIIKLVADNYSWNYRNMGIGSQTTANVIARFQADVLDLHPRACIFIVGLNDISTSVPEATIFANFRSMMDDCFTNGIIPIIITLVPWNAGSDAQHAIRRSINDDLQIFVKSHRAIHVDADPILGVTRVSTGELDDLNTTLDAPDTLHLNTAGNTALANQIIADLDALTSGGGTAEVAPNIISVGYPVQGGVPAQPGMRRAFPIQGSTGATGGGGGGGGGSFTPADITTELWFDANDAGNRTLVGSDVQQLSDKSGNDRHLTAPSAGVRPELISGGQNSLDLVRFVGSEYLQHSTFSGGAIAQPLTFFIVCLPDQSTASEVIFDGRDSTSTRNLLYTLSGGDYAYFAGSIQDSNTTRATSMTQLTVTYNGASSLIRENGTQIHTGNAGTQNLNGLILAENVTIGFPSDLDFCELVVVQNATAQNISDVEDYLKTKWDTP